MARNTSESSSTLSKIGFAITSYISKPGKLFLRKGKSIRCRELQLVAHLGALDDGCDKAVRLRRGSSLRLWQRVLKFIGMLAVGGDVDRQLSSEARQLSGAGIWRHRDRELGYAASHETGVMQDKSSASALQGAVEFLNRHVNPRALGIAGGQHLAFARAFQIAVKLLVNRHSAKRWVSAFVVRLGR